MPHKRNPILSERICGLARILRGNLQVALENVALWHERDISHSSAERVTLPDGCSVDDALKVIAELIPDGKGLPESCLIAVSGTHLGTVRDHQPQILADGDELVVIAPVAGG